jgi:diguanylate cyclase
VELLDLGRLNAFLGYSGGDRLLAEFATRLSTGFGSRTRVVRIGTRKFAIVLSGLRGSAHGLLAARKVEQLVEPSIEIDGHSVALAVAQGLAIYPQHAASADELLRCAEMALDDASTGDRGFAVYDGAATTELQATFLVETAFVDALANGRIEPWFQPQLDLKTGRVIGAEALLRCRDWNDELLAPERVIEAAERLRRLDELTWIVLSESLRRGADWPAPVQPLRISVNLSATTLRDVELVDRVRNALSLWGVNPQRLTLEITESVFMDEPDRCFETMRRLRELGVRVAIDDFGTGYSSLAYFRDIPASELKVDKCFVGDMLRDVASRRIVQAVIDLAHGFELDVVAEGVEDEPTLEALRSMGCDLAQGYLVGRPMPAADFVRWLQPRVQ